MTDGMKQAIDGLFTRFQTRLDNKFSGDIAGKKAFLSALLPVIDNVINSVSGVQKSMFQYLKERIVEYQAMVELEDVLNVN
ncbi:MAG: hypothetical protein GXP45_00080 [bacterium]|nr:hypothetical protein [bacterium]